MTDYAVNHEYELKLKELQAKHHKRAAQVKANQPALTPNIETRLRLALPNAPYRATVYLWNHPGARTDEISAACGIGNISDAFTNSRYKPSFHKLGLMVHCEVENARNRFGDRTIIGRWWLDITDLSKLYDDAANDPDRLVKQA